MIRVFGGFRVRGLGFRASVLGFTDLGRRRGILCVCVCRDVGFGIFLRLRASEFQVCEPGTYSLHCRSVTVMALTYQQSHEVRRTGHRHELLWVLNHGAKFRV